MDSEPGRIIGARDLLNLGLLRVVPTFGEHWLLFLHQMQLDFGVTSPPLSHGRPTFLLREYGRTENDDKVIDPDIPDPIGCPASVYKTCLDAIKEDIERVAESL